MQPFDLTTESFPIMKIIAIFVAVLFVIALMVRSTKMRKAREQRFRDAFESVFSESTVRPTYEQSYSYGYPSFTVTFPSKTDMQHSDTQRRTKRFKEEIAQCCKDSGSKKYPFDAERAIWFTYEGEIDAVRSKLQIPRD